MSDLVERARTLAMTAHGLIATTKMKLGAVIPPGHPEAVAECLDEAADAVEAQAAEITRLRAALADAQAVGFAAGVEAAAQKAEEHASDLLDKADFYQPPRANADPYLSDIHEQASAGVHQVAVAIRALTPPDATAAAARVLLPGMEQRHIDHMTSLGRDPEKYTSEYRMAAKALRAIAGDTP